MQILMKTTLFLLVVVAGLSVFEQAAFGQARSPAEQKKEIDRLKDLVTEAGKKFKAGELEETGKLVTEGFADATKLNAELDPKSRKGLEPILQKLINAHQLLVARGVAMPPLSSAAEGKVSFVKDLAPWMVAQCGQCHIQSKRGQFSMETFADIMKGNQGGVVIFPNDPKGSRLVEVIETGDMPRNGKVSPENLAKLKKWVEEGAVFDGLDPRAQLAALIGKANPAGNGPGATPEMESKPTGKETVSFGKDIAPILIEQCSGCHVEARRVMGGLNMSTFAQLIRGGTNGPIVAPKDPDASMLIKKLRGQAGVRMPAGGKPPLSEERIQLIATWIRENATFDGESKEMRLASVKDAAWVKGASDTDLRDRRREASRKQWKLAAPKMKAEEASDDELMVLGDLNAEEAGLLLKTAQEASKIVKKQLKIESDKPIVRGGVTVFAFAKRYDYGEFGKMVETRTLPPEWSGHWRKQTVDTYIVMHFDPKEGAKNKALLVQLLSSVHVGALADVPQWFGDGVGRSTVATVMASEDPRIKEWVRLLPTVSSKIKEPNQILEGKLGEEDAALAGFALVKTISTGNSRKQYEQLLRQLHNGISFDEAFTGVFGPPELFVRKWLGLPRKG